MLAFISVNAMSEIDILFWLGPIDIKHLVQNVLINSDIYIYLYHWHNLQCHDYNGLVG